MTTRELAGAPSMLPLYAKAAVPLVPGASMLPFVGPGGGEIPELELVLPEARVDAGHLAAYGRVCGFGARDDLPPTFPHVLAFPLQMALMTDGSFPFGPVGLVHVKNRITQHRPVRRGEPLSLRVHPTGLEPHPKGRQFSIVTEARVGDELVWDEESTYLRREKDGGGGREEDASPRPELRRSAQWQLAGDLGRRYAGVSGDRNPIHLYGLSAKLFGFPRAIAHGMWAKARCLAALESRLPVAYTAEARFRKPVLLPSTVAFDTAREDGRTFFRLREAEQGTPHVDGSVSAA